MKEEYRREMEQLGPRPEELERLYRVMEGGAEMKKTKRLGGKAAAVLVCGSSLASYCVYLRLKYNCVVRLGGAVFVMGLEALAMLAAFALALWALAEGVRKLTKEERA